LTENDEGKKRPRSINKKRKRKGKKDVSNIVL